jgi:gamma-glutamylcyclotransferase (GGCT)/AIG2-like uncharacterized protein YtfP
VSDEFIFVYGTLRRKTATAMHYLLARHCDYISDGYMQGKLYEVDGYPGAVESENADDKVKGELYKLTSRDLLLPALDEYEESTSKYPQPHEYIRKNILISLSGDESVSAWVYVFNHSVSGLKLIESGDYLQVPEEITG